MSTSHSVDILSLGKAILEEDARIINYCWHGKPGLRKTVNTVPHDLGDPGKIGAYFNLDVINLDVCYNPRTLVVHGKMSCSFTPVL